LVATKQTLKLAKQAKEVLDAYLQEASLAPVRGFYEYYHQKGEEDRHDELTEIRPAVVILMSIRK
jgi:hypothetical protein